MINNEDLARSKEWIKVTFQRSVFFQSTLLLENGFKHAFFTKKVSKNEPQKLLNLISDNSSIHFLKQVHGNKVIYASKSNAAKIIKADSIISDKHSQSLWIYTADCIPILLGDSKTGHVAAIHSGWKGLVQKIIKSTIEKLELNGSNRKNILVAIGPAISLDNYQVDEEIVIKIYESIKKIKCYQSKDILNYMRSINSVEVDLERHKYLLDIRKIAKEQLLLEGFDRNQISVNSNCTFQEAQMFESWRREHSKSRQWSFIQSRIFK